MRVDPVRKLEQHLLEEIAAPERWLAAASEEQEENLKANIFCPSH